MTPESEIVEPDPAYAWIWRAWHRLTHERQWQTRGVSMAMGGSIIHPYPTPIPWSSVVLWCHENDYTESTRLFLDHCLVAMDTVFINWWSEQAKQKG